MRRHDTIRLHETKSMPPVAGEVIDVRFSEVGGPRRTFWGRIKGGLQALLWAAVIGFLIPPVWVLLQLIGDMFRPL
jgi:hypothetical protein